MGNAVDFNERRQNTLDDILKTQGEHNEAINTLKHVRNEDRQFIIGLRSILDSKDETYRQERKEERAEIMGFIERIEGKVEKKIESMETKISVGTNKINETIVTISNNLNEKLSSQNKYIFVGLGILIASEFFMKVFIK
jgi:lipopolysaccharide biosynthesis regulator YciM